MLNMDIEGLDDLRRKLDELRDNIESLEGEHDIFTPDFMRQHTDHSTIEAFLEATGYKMESQEDYEAIPDDEFDDFVRENTQFSSWEEMLEAAVAVWTQKQLGFD